LKCIREVIVAVHCFVSIVSIVDCLEPRDM